MNTGIDSSLDEEGKTENDEDFKSDVDDVCMLVPGFDEFDIANYRESVGMSQSEFAREHDISLSTLKKWERNASKPTFDKTFWSILDRWLRWRITNALTGK